MARFDDDEEASMGGAHEAGRTAPTRLDSVIDFCRLFQFFGLAPSTVGNGDDDDDECLEPE